MLITTCPSVSTDLTRIGTIELSSNLSGNRNSIIDLHGDDTYTDYGLRLYRFPGTTGVGGISYNGTGELTFDTIQSGIPIKFYTAAWPSLILNNTSANISMHNLTSSTPPSEIAAGTKVGIDIQTESSLNNSNQVEIGIRNFQIISNSAAITATQSKHGIYNYTDLNYTNAASYGINTYGINNQVISESSCGNSNSDLSNVYGINTVVDIGSTGSTYKYFKDIYANVSKVSLTGSTATTGILTGAYVSVDTTSTNVSTNIYGVRVVLNLSGTADNVYGFHTGESVNNYFGGSIQIGGTASGPSSGAAGLGVGTASPGTTGMIRATNDVVAYYSSDKRYKENIENIQSPLEKINKIRGVSFDWTQEYLDNHGGEDEYFLRKHDIGVIAQEIEEILPEIIGTREDGFKAVKYEKLTPLLIEAIKSQQQLIRSLSDRILALESLNMKIGGI